MTFTPEGIAAGVFIGFGMAAGLMLWALRILVTGRFPW
jgi:hypothetical protein